MFRKKKEKEYFTQEQINEFALEDLAKMAKENEEMLNRLNQKLS